MALHRNICVLLGLGETLHLLVLVLVAVYQLRSTVSLHLEELMNLNTQRLQAIPSC